MKKIISLFSLLSMVVAINATKPVYTEPAETWTVGDVAALDAYKYNSLTVHGYKVTGAWVSVSAYDMYKATPDKQKWTAQTGFGATGATAVANGVFAGTAYYDKDGKVATARADRAYSFKVTNAQKISVYGNNDCSEAGDRVLMVNIYEGNDSVAEQALTGVKEDAIMSIGKLDTKKTYTVVVYGVNSSNSKFYEIAFCSDTTKALPEEAAVAPTPSVLAGTYFETFKVALTSPKADHIYYSINGAAYAEYKDSIEIVGGVDKKYEMKAYSTMEGIKNSDTVSIVYEMKIFIARPAFKAETVLDLANLKKDDIQVISGDNGEFTEYTMDGQQVPALNYKHLTCPDGSDSLLILGFKNCPGLTIQYKNSEPKANVFKFGQRFLQIDSKNSMFFLEGVHSGDTIVIVATAKGTSAPTHFDHTYSSACYLKPFQPEDDSDPNFTDGDIYTPADAITDNDYSGYTNLVYVVEEGGHSKVRIKETGNGARIAKILVNAYRGDEVPKHEAVENVMGDVKVTKTVENGQLVIIKNGVRYSAMGAAL